MVKSLKKNDGRTIHEWCSPPKFTMDLVGMSGIYSNKKLVDAGVPLLDSASRQDLND